MFILIDYLMFRLGKGKYSLTELRKRHPINLSWDGEYDPILEEILHGGDILFFSHSRSPISWAVRYFTKTDISHCGVYLGNGNVLHATLSGSRVDKLKSFFDHGYSVVPVSTQVPPEIAESANYDDFIGSKYPLRSEVFRAISFIMGVPWRKFRFTYLVDVLLAFSLVSLLISHQNFFLLLVCLYTPYLLLVLSAFLLKTKLRIPIMDPGEGFYYLPKDFHAIPSVKKMNEPWFLDAFLKATRSTPQEERRDKRNATDH